MKPYKTFLLLSSLAMLVQSSPAQEQKQTESIKKKENAMKTESNRHLIRSLYEDCLNKRNYDMVQELVSSEYSGPRGEKGAEGLINTVKPIITAFPDIRWKIEDLLEEGNNVIVRWSWTGTHTKEINGFAPSNKVVKNEAIAIYQFKDGKIISVNMQSDRLGFLQQIGVIPQDILSGPKK